MRYGIIGDLHRIPEPLRESSSRFRTMWTSLDSIRGEVASRGQLDWFDPLAEVVSQAARATEIASHQIIAGLRRLEVDG